MASFRQSIITFLSALRNQAQHKIFYYLVVGSLFLVAFALPIFFAIGLGRNLFPSSNSEEVQGNDSLFPHALRIAGPNSYLSIADAPDLEPQGDADFLVSAWVRLRRLPNDGERMLLFAKYDAESRSRRGYAVALAREGDVLRPEVYWRDNSDNGTWFTFSDLIMPARSWTLFALSFRKQRLLGLHAATIVEPLPPRLQILGGYELEHTIIPDSDSPLMIGSVGVSRFRGNIGPVGIFSQPNLSEHLNEIIHNLTVLPTKIPPQFESSEVRFWSIDGKTDLSPYNHSVTTVKGARDDDGED